MKKVLAIVLALVMVCTMAMAIDITGGDTSSKSGNAKGYAIIDILDNTNTVTKETAGTLTITTTTPKVTKDTDTTTTEYKAVEYVFADTAVIDANTYYAVDSSAARYKLVKDGKIVAFLTTENPGAVTAAVSKVVKHAKNTVLKCGDYQVEDNMDGMKVTAATTLYTINDKVYNGATGEQWAVLNGAFVKYTGTPATLIKHNFDAADVNAKEGVVTSVYCKNCKAYIPVVLTDDIPVTTLDQYEALTGTLDDYSYLVKAVSTAAATTNPDTGANDVIGVAAALAVVALVSGAAISLKK